jgi:acyl-CoA synthetase (AMP-forming)/AMP-acid ligase II
MRCPTVTTNLQRSADLHANRCALVDGTGRFSYSEVWQGACAVAVWLERNGLARGERVAIVLDNSYAYVVAYYGSLLAGAIVVPLNESAKARDFSIWLNDSSATFVFCRANPEVRLALTGLGRPPRAVLVGDCDPAWSDAVSFAAVIDIPRWLEPPRVRPPVGDDPASILYTSGTTGRPKGVLLTHTNLASNTAAIVEYLALSSADSIVSVLPFYYSYGNSVLHTHIAAGASIFIENNFVFPHAVVERLSTERATGFAGVPSTFALLLTRVRLADYDLSALRYVTQAGGPMSPSLTSNLRSALSHCRLFVMYGQTEATARLTYLPPERLDEKLGSVGVPVRGCEIETRFEDGRPAPRGESGDVWVRGPNIMLGYWHDPGATAATLQNGWLKTGDVGYLDGDGFLYLLGRRSDIIKTGAHRVHPKDVEEVIAEFPGVQEVAVIGVEDELLGEAIKAFIVAVPGVTPDLREIKALVRSRLATYKVPKYLELVTALPKTSTGKLRRIDLVERTVS